MAGQGKKTFSDGEVLSAADVNGYLMDQSVMRFADSSARTAAIGTPTEGMVTYLDDVNQIEVYDGTAWVDQQAPILSEGTAGQYLQSNGTAGSQWVNLEIADDIITTEGDLIVGGVGGDAERLGIGPAESVLTSDGTVVSWAVAGGGGGGLTLLNLPFESPAVFDFEIPVGSSARFSMITSSTSPFEFQLFDDSDNFLETITVDRDNPFTYVTATTAVAQLKFNNNVIGSETPILAITNPTSAANPTTIEIISIFETQSVTLTKSYNATLIGGGGGGGGANSANSSGGGGGSGFLSAGVINAGTYTATIGAGGDGAGSTNGDVASTGGTTSIGSLTALGGEGSSTGGTTAGADGGSGGGAGTNQEEQRKAGGQNGGNGQSSNAALGGQGSQTTIPGFPVNSVITIAGFYNGGQGGNISPSGLGSNGANGAGPGNGGGGASQTSFSNNNRVGGDGADGFILLTEVL